MGLKAGSQLEIWRAGHEILYPQTRVSIGRSKDKLIGKIQIESVTENLSIARTIEGGDFKVGDLVRLIAATK